MEKIEICGIILIIFGIFLTLCVGPFWLAQQEYSKNLDNQYSVPMIISLFFVFIGAILFTL